MFERSAALYRYWGKTGSSNSRTPWHLAAHHGWDAGAVASEWLVADDAMLGAFARLANRPARECLGWACLLVALHDLGKFDVRFQLKEKDVALRLNPELLNAAGGLSYDHAAGTKRYARSWFAERGVQYGEMATDVVDAIAAHHGSLPLGQLRPPPASPATVALDAEARCAFASASALLFLGRVPARESAPDIAFLLRGFCSVCDWIASNEEYFAFVPYPMESPAAYLDEARKKARSALEKAGVLRPIRRVTEWGDLFPPDIAPRGIQRDLAQWRPAAGLTIVEAPTGTGKTEAALWHATRLVSAGFADTILFALPTQASANAIHERLAPYVTKLFGDHATAMLAHGKAWLNPFFCGIRSKGAQWLFESRKRSFLAPVGVCTIDQVLMSVLPLRHSFVRAFGVARSVLVIDEAHAYDTYMNGLLDVLLKKLREAGSSVIILSATLPKKRRAELAALWGSGAVDAADYPLVTQLTSGPPVHIRSVAETGRIVRIERETTPEGYPSDGARARIVDALAHGAAIGVVCNLVDHAQRMARDLRAMSVEVDLFHSRYRFRDRMYREAWILDTYGPKRMPGPGRVLVGTQVIEQSLDLDFDWMVTQLCPVDLLFQRLGRLHRHERARPPGMESPRALVVIPEEREFAGHGAIYRQLRVLWRTKRLVDEHQTIEFPEAYRSWIEAVYAEAAAHDDPDWVTTLHEKWTNGDYVSHLKAITVAMSDINPWPDTDERAAKLTREGEPALSVILYTLAEGRRHTIDGDPFKGESDPEFHEQRTKEVIPVPDSWRHANFLPTHEDGYYYVRVREVAPGVWEDDHTPPRLRYTRENGLERLDRESSS